MLRRSFLLQSEAPATPRAAYQLTDVTLDRDEDEGAAGEEFGEHVIEQEDDAAAGQEQESTKEHKRDLECQHRVLERALRELEDAHSAWEDQYKQEKEWRDIPEMTDLDRWREGLRKWNLEVQKQRLLFQRRKQALVRAYCSDLCKPGNSWICIDLIYEGTFQPMHLVPLSGGQVKTQFKVEHGSFKEVSLDPTPEDFASFSAFKDAVATYVAIWSRLFGQQHPHVMIAMQNALANLARWEETWTARCIIYHTLKHLESLLWDSRNHPSHSMKLAGWDNFESVANNFDEYRPDAAYRAWNQRKGILHQDHQQNIPTTCNQDWGQHILSQTRQHIYDLS